MIVLKTKDFILRRPKISDLKSFHKNKNDPVIAKNMFRPIYPLSIKQAKKDLLELIKDNKKKENDVFMIDINGNAIGMIELFEIIPNHKAKIGYWVGNNYRGKGIGTKALKLMTRYGFKKYNLKKITANVFIYNKASAKALEKAGFKLEGILKKNRLKNNKYIDDKFYAILR